LVAADTMSGRAGEATLASIIDRIIWCVIA
jgi:hypothetical protein